MTTVQLVLVVASLWLVLAVALGLVLSVWIRRINRYTPEPASLPHRRSQAA